MNNIVGILIIFLTNAVFIVKKHQIYVDIFTIAMKDYRSMGVMRNEEYNNGLKCDFIVCVGCKNLQESSLENGGGRKTRTRNKRKFDGF